MNNPKNIHELLFILSLSLFIFCPSFAQENVESSKQELEKIQEKLKVVQVKIDALDKQEKGVLNRIDAYEEKITLTKQLIKSLGQAQKNKTKEIQSLNAKIDETQNQITNHRSDLEKLLINFYKYKRIYPLEAILSEKTMAGAYRKSVYLRIAAEQNTNQIQQFYALQKDLRLQQTQLIAATNELARLKQLRENERSDLKDLQDSEKKILTKVHTEKDENITLQQELSAAAKKLEKLIADLEARRRERKLAPGTHYLEIMKGKLPWPYDGQVVSYFGSQEDPKYKTKVNNTGIDIKCPSDADIQAIAPGRIVYADRFMGYGNMIILDHSDGFYSLYSNLSEMTSSVGTNVQQGDVIGKSKDILHFELRVEGKPVNPLNWLSQ
jgi:septal ring factor EnvC (AmiA/AmiB activator)